jgi:D-mannonate dehydratase
MKKVKLIVAGGALLSLAVFQSCNSEEAVKAAQAAAESRLTAVKDSLQGAWKADVDALKANYEAQIQTLNDSLASVTAKLEAAVAKKTGATTTTAKKPATTTTTPKKEEATPAQQKAAEQKKRN